MKLSLTFLYRVIPNRYRERKVVFSAIVSLLKNKFMIPLNKQRKINEDAKSDYKPFVQPNQFLGKYLPAAYANSSNSETDAKIEKVKESYRLFYEITYQIWARDKINKNKSTNS